MIGLAAGVFLGLVGPFGMDRVPIGVRVAYWVAAILAGTLVGVAVSVGVARWIDPAARPAACGVATTLAMTPPATLAVWAVTRLFFPQTAVFASLIGLLGPVLVVSAGMTALNALATVRAAIPPAAPAPPVSPVSAPAGVRFRDRLPHRLRSAEIHAVEAQDHYLRVHTDRGSDLVLMRLADAIFELEGIEGAQTHRSWWVARSAVRTVRRDDGRPVLVLTGGLEAPVSRTHGPKLRAAGWY